MRRNQQRQNYREFQKHHLWLYSLFRGNSKKKPYKKRKFDLTNIKKNLTLAKLKYILVQKIGAYIINEIEIPDPEDLKQIIDYQQLYDLKLNIELNKLKEEIMKET